VPTFWKRFFMWDYPRGSIAYDLKVAAILAFIFLTPPSWFQDQPLLSRTRGEIVMLPDITSETRFWLEQSLVEGIPVGERQERLGALLSERTGVQRHVLRVDSLRSANDEIQGYVAITRP
jgi:hypothetical protein